MNIHSYQHKKPNIDKEAKVFDGAQVIGEVSLGKNVGVWFNAVLRADMDKIVVGENTNIQDGTIIHTDENQPTIIGKNVTIGHKALIHAATIEDGALIGMGSIILNGAIVEKEALVGAGAVVPPGKIIKAKTLVFGNPAKEIKTLSEKDIENIKNNTDHYVKLLKSY